MRTFLRNSFPICFLEKSQLLLFKKGSFQILDINTGDISRLIDFTMTLKELVLTKIPFFVRVLRKGVRCGKKLTEDLIVFVIGNRICELDLKNRSISKGFTNTDKSRPLSFTKIQGIKGFKDGCYFGGYKDNPQKNPISIYRRVETDSWEEVYRFPINSIEHVHTIIPDPFLNVVYIFTGDFDRSAGIWIAEKNFLSVKPLMIGDQVFRSCVGFPTPQGLIYATDSPFSQNSIRLLKKNDNYWESIPLMDIKGPSIYGCQWGKDFVFSTSVEGGSRTDTLSYLLFGIKRGKGVLDNFTHIYKGNLKDGFQEIYQAKKDLLPYYFFQFGALIFPSDLNESTYLPVYHIATSRNGMGTILLKNE